jgi:hypothetical protein
VELVASLPLTNVGKVSKRELREDAKRKIAVDQAAPVKSIGVDVGNYSVSSAG